MAIQCLMSLVYRFSGWNTIHHLILIKVRTHTTQPIQLPLLPLMVPFPYPHGCSQYGAFFFRGNEQSPSAVINSTSKASRWTLFYTLMQEAYFPKSMNVGPLVCLSNHIIGIVETWLDKSIQDSEFIENYNLVRLDCNRHGGVLIYVITFLLFNFVFSNSIDLELLVLSVSFPLCVITFCIFYHPPPVLLFWILCACMLMLTYCPS